MRSDAVKVLNWWLFGVHCGVWPCASEVIIRPSRRRDEGGEGVSVDVRTDGIYKCVMHRTILTGFVGFTA